MTITMQTAKRAFRITNDAGHGYAPYTDVPNVDTVNAAANAAVDDGGQRVLYRETDDDVAVLHMPDGGLMAIGDVNGPWAVDLANVVTDSEIRMLLVEASRAGDSEQIRQCDIALASGESVARVEARIACAFAIADAKGQ